VVYWVNVSESSGTSLLGLSKIKAIRQLLLFKQYFLCQLHYNWQKHYVILTCDIS